MAKDFDLGGLIGGLIAPLAQNAVQGAAEQRLHIPAGDLGAVAASAATYFEQDMPNLDSAQVARVVAMLEDPTIGPSLAAAIDKAIIDYTLHRVITQAVSAVPIGSLGG